MKKALALMLSGMMLTAPLAAVAETAEEPAALKMMSFSVSDLMAEVSGISLDFTGMTCTGSAIMGTDGVLCSAELSAGGASALELTGVVEGTQLTLVLLGRDGVPAEPAVTLDIAPYLEMVQQQMSGAATDPTQAMQELTTAAQEALQGVQVSELYTADVTYPDGTVVSMNLTDYVLPAEYTTPLLKKVLEMAGQNAENVPALAGALSTGTSGDGMHTYYELALANEEQTVKAMMFGTTGETGVVYDALVYDPQENVVLSGQLALGMGETGLEMDLSVSAGPLSAEMVLSFAPTQTGAEGAFALIADQTGEDGESVFSGALSFNYAYEEKDYPAENYSIAAGMLKSVPAVTVEALSDPESEIAQQATAAWMGAAMQGLEALKDVPAVQLLMSYVTMLTQSAAEAAQ